MGRTSRRFRSTVECDPEDGMRDARIGIFGWGVVAPRSKDIDEFHENLRSNRTWMEPFEGFGPSNFLVGVPRFDFQAYRPWIEERFKPARFAQLTKHSGDPVRYAV